MSCPIKIPKIIRECEACMFSKENGICDYPYYKGMRLEEIRKVKRNEIRPATTF